MGQEYRIYLSLRSSNRTYNSPVADLNSIELEVAYSMESPFKDTVAKGKVALVTGGGTGIGFEICTQLGKHGASIAIMSRRKNVVDAAAAALQAQGIQAIGIQGDVRNKEDAARVVEITVNHFGRLDILVNNAAGNFLVPAEDLSPNGLRTVLDIDAVGTFTMSQAALKYLRKGGVGKPSSEAGVILNITATIHYSAYWYQIHVSAAKAAIDSLTRSLALEWGTDYGIRVNGIAPGPIEGTPGMDIISPKEFLGDLRTNQPLYKEGEKWDVAMAIIYLASDSGKYVNGTVLVVDGGLWLSQPRLVPRETIKSISRVVENKSRATDYTPKSKL